MDGEDRRRRHKAHLYELFARISAAMANPHRLELLDLLVQAPRTVEELSLEAQMSMANTSQHLQRLKKARLVTAESAGSYRRYRLADPAVARLWLELRAVAEKQLEDVEPTLEVYRHRRKEFESMDAAGLIAMLEKNEAVLLDVRPAVEYQTAHLPGAVSIPWDELQDRLDELPADKQIVAYCRGPYCVYADEALAILSKAGWDVARLEEGVAEWQHAGYSLAKGF